MIFEGDEKMGKINEKQKKAAENFIRIGNKKEALLSAGYTAETIERNDFANSFFEREYIRDYIKEYIQGKTSKTAPDRVADEREIMEYLTGILRGGITEEVFVNKQFINRPPSLRDRNKAAELLGKHYGLYSEKKNSKRVEGIEIKVDVDE